MVYEFSLPNILQHSFSLPFYMRKKYLLGALLLGLLSIQSAHAQYEFTDTKLQPYTQDFNTLTGNAAMTANHLTVPAEVYAQATFPGTIYTNFSPATIGANDGSNNVAYYYHFGSSAVPGDRAFGGIAGTTFTANGIGYVGIRLKNSSAVTIKNLEVQYAMEQWYNSGKQDAARVDVDYQVGTTVADLLTGTWTSIAALGVDAPSTATVIASRDGNSAANRRVLKTTLAVNLEPGQEIMLRWGYVLNSATNGNGLSIDDVVITPETNVFYSKTTGDLGLITTWGQNTDGSGIAPADFTTDNQTFYVMSSAVNATENTTDRILSGTSVNNITTWTVSGANSKIVVGTSTVPATLMVAPNKNISGVIDVSPSSYFTHKQAQNPAFTFGSLATTSTVEYNTSDAQIPVQATQYGNLTISGSNSDRSLNARALTGNTILAGNLSIAPGSNLLLGSNDLTILSSGSLATSSATGYVVTNGTGRLRLQVPRVGTSGTAPVVTFPVGSSVTSYTPITLQQTTTNSDDVFEARVIDNVYQNYAATTYAPIGDALTSRIVKKTWFISKEVPNNASNVTMTMQWNAGEVGTTFSTAAAHINHYTEGAWDTNATETGATGTGPYVLKRSGITSFSPFGVSSQPGGVLPVELTAFGAQRTGASVRCTWSTASEQNSRNFSVERSLDGKTFTTLGSVPAAGSSVTPRSYAFLDAQPTSALAYYRLRQFDLDGKQAFSNVVVVAGTASTDFTTAAPNPTNGPLDIAAEGITQASVLNVLGGTMLTRQLAAPAAHISLDLSSLPAGVYLVRLTTVNGPQVVRVTRN
jgi:hypothetical protein